MVGCRWGTVEMAAGEKYKKLRGRGKKWKRKKKNWGELHKKRGKRPENCIFLGYKIPPAEIGGGRNEQNAHISLEFHQ